MYPDKEAFNKEILTYGDTALQDCFLVIYDHVVFNKTLPDPKAYCEDLLKKLFNPKGLLLECMVPLTFLSSVPGSIVMAAYYGAGEGKYYSINELLELTKTDYKPEGLSKALVSKDIKLGKLNAVKKGRNYYFPEDEVRRYLHGKGID